MPGSPHSLDGAGSEDRTGSLYGLLRCLCPQSTGQAGSGWPDLIAESDLKVAPFLALFGYSALRLCGPPCSLEQVARGLQLAGQAVVFLRTLVGRLDDHLPFVASFPAERVL